VTVKGTAAAKEGLAIARAFRPDLIILDWVLKEMSGENLARLLRMDAATKAIPTIMISAVVEPDDAPRARAAGAHLFMTKEQIRTALNSYGRPDARPSSRRVLVIEDDAGTQDFIRCVLASSELELSFAADGRSGLQAARASEPSLILLDLGLPCLNGVDVFKLLKLDPTTKRIPILLMTAMVDSSGAMDSLVETLHPNDYIHKPFGAEEFAARVKRLLASPPEERAEAAASRPDLVLERGRIRLNATRNEVTVEGRPVKLTPQLFVLLRLLIAHQEAVSLDRLLAEGWPNGSDPNAVKQAVKRLRDALALSADPVVATGRGYKLIG